MNKIRTSIMLSKESREIADSIAEVDERTRSYILDKAIEEGLKRLDSPKARALRAKKVKK
jgi:predicted transcriptional regulator